MSKREMHTVTVKVGVAPAARHGNGRHNWEYVAEVLKQFPDQDVLIPQFEDTDGAVSILTIVNRERDYPAALAALGGKVVAMSRNNRRDENNVRRADILFHWTPDPV